MRPKLSWFGMMAALILASTSCATAPTDSRSQADVLVSEMSMLAGVAEVTADVTNRIETGDPHVWISVNMTDTAAPDQVVDVVDHYLNGVRDVGFRGHLTELDVHGGDDRFTVDGGPRPVTNGAQILGEATDWADLRRALPSATVDLRATVTHADATPDWSGHAVIGRIDLPEPAGASEVAATVARLSADFGRLAGGTWTVAGSKAHPSSMNAVGRLPSAREMEVFTAVETDQTIAHVSSLNVNTPRTPPVWLSEWVPTHDPAIRIDLAARHLPVVAALPAPVLYTATDQPQGLRDFFGRATGPVAVTVGGCTTRTYPVEPAEQKLIARYERCPHA